MKNALEYLLVTKLGGEVLPDFSGYELWEIVFPKGFANVASKASKSTNMGKAPATKLLRYYADEWIDDPDKRDLVSVADSVTAFFRKRDEHSQASARELMNGLSLFPEASSPLDRAKTQLVESLGDMIRQSDKLEARIRLGCGDPWLEGYRGLGFLFDPTFKETFVQLLCHDFTWKANDPVFVECLTTDIDNCTRRYLTSDLDDGEEVRLIESLLVICLAACLVGPGSFAQLLGYDTTLKTELDGFRLEPISAREVLCYQMQPVVFTSYDIYSYYTDDADPIQFTSDEVVRFGRYDEGSADWLGQHRAVVAQSSQTQVSRMHAELRHIRGKGWFLKDMGTLNGTTVFRAYGGGVIYCSRENDEASRSIRINTGDVIFLGPSAESRRRAPGHAFVEVGVRNQAYRFERVIK